jgi:hypothetical protein
MPSLEASYILRVLAYSTQAGNDSKETRISVTTSVSMWLKMDICIAQTVGRNCSMKEFETYLVRKINTCESPVEKAIYQDVLIKYMDLYGPSVIKNDYTIVCIKNTYKVTRGNERLLLELNTRTGEITPIRVRLLSNSNLEELSINKIKSWKQKI